MHRVQHGLVDIAADVNPIEKENQQPKAQSNFCGEAIILEITAEDKAPLCAQGTGAEAATQFRWRTCAKSFVLPTTEGGLQTRSAKHSK